MIAEIGQNSYSGEYFSLELFHNTPEDLIFLIKLLNERDVRVFGKNWVENDSSLVRKCLQNLDLSQNIL